MSDDVRATCDSPKLIARFWAKVKKTESGCWEWTGYLDSGGYGLFRINNRQIRPHRFSYEFLVGPIPDGLTIDHLCRNRKCVNPAHLEAVTMRENTLRGFGPTAVNAFKDTCKNGHPLSGENLRILSDGERACKVCQRVASRSSRKRRRDIYNSARRVVRYTACPDCSNWSIGVWANDKIARHSVGFGSVEKVGPGTRYPPFRTRICSGSGKAALTQPTRKSE